MYSTENIVNNSVITLYFDRWLANLKMLAYFLIPVIHEWWCGNFYYTYLDMYANCVYRDIFFILITMYKALNFV